MSKMLASVNSLAEALLAQSVPVDIIDLKQPAEGALGALDRETIQSIVSKLAGTCTLSATLGDLALYPDIIVPAAQAMAANGVNYIKIGFFPGGDTLGTLTALSSLTNKHALIAVLFADSQPDFSLIPALHSAGFRGVMLDTMDKQRGSLRQLLPDPLLAEFVSSAKRYDLLTGLAGSLRLTDIGPLLPLNADYLGFRGALCQQQQRTSALDSNALLNVKHALSACG